LKNKIKIRKELIEEEENIFLKGIEEEFKEELEKYEKEIEEEKLKEIEEIEKRKIETEIIVEVEKNPKLSEKEEKASKLIKLWSHSFFIFTIFY